MTCFIILNSLQPAGRRRGVSYRAGNPVACWLGRLPENNLLCKTVLSSRLSGEKDRGLARPVDPV